MTFYLNNKDYHVNINNVFDVAKDEDYVDMIDTLNVIMHNLPYPEFDSSTVMLVYDEENDVVSVEVCDKMNDTYYIVKGESISIPLEEMNLIREKMKCIC